MKQSILSILAGLLLVSSLYVSANAEENGGVVQAATENSIEITSILEVDYDHVSYQLEASTSQALADEGYFFAVQYSNNPNFSSGNGLGGNMIVESDGEGGARRDVFDQETISFVRYSHNLVPGVHYYVRPMIISRSAGWNNPAAVGEMQEFDAPADDTAYTALDANWTTIGSNMWGWLHGKYTASTSGTYAMVTESGNYDFITYQRAGITEYWRVSYTDGQDDMSLFFDMDAGETIYLFARAQNGSGKVRVIPAQEAAPTVDTIEVGDPLETRSTYARFNFDISTTIDTAKNGYHYGIIYGEPGTDPLTWKGRVVFRINYRVLNQRLTSGQDSGFVPGMNVDYQAALFDDSYERVVLARGNSIHRLQTPGTLDGFIQLAEDTAFSWNDVNKKSFWFEAPAEGMYAVQVTGANSIAVVSQDNRTLGGKSGTSSSLLGAYAKQGEIFYVFAFNNNGNSCRIEVTDGLSNLPAAVLDSTVGLNGATPVCFRAPETGNYRFSLSSSEAQPQVIGADGRWQTKEKQFEIGLVKNQVLWLRADRDDGSTLELTVKNSSAAAKLVFPTELTMLQTQACEGLAIQEAVFSSKIQSIGEKAFADCTELIAVLIPNKDVNIAENAFENCPHVTLIAPTGGTVQSYAQNHINVSFQAMED